MKHEGCAKTHPSFNLLLSKFKSRPRGYLGILHLLKLHFENRYKKAQKPYGIWVFLVGIYFVNTTWLRGGDLNLLTSGLFSQTLGVCLPCCGTHIVLSSFHSVALCDRCHSLAFLYPPSAAVGSFPHRAPLVGLITRVQKMKSLP